MCSKTLVVGAIINRPPNKTKVKSNSRAIGNRPYAHFFEVSEQVYFALDVQSHFFD